MALARFWKQSYFIPAPELTETTLPDQSGRVFIVTGGYAGCGYELCKILYQRNGVVYVAGRSQTKAEGAIEMIKEVRMRGKDTIGHGAAMNTCGASPDDALLESPRMSGGDAACPTNKASRDERTIPDLLLSMESCQMRSCWF